MSSINNNNKVEKQENHSNSCEPNLGFQMDIQDDFIEHFTNFEQKMFKDIKDSFGLLSEEKNHPREPQEKEQNQENQENKENGTYISKVYCSSYNNINGQPKQEYYQSQSIKQIYNGHKISEAREAYKNTDGIMKSALQRNLDEKGARFIKEKNNKNGKHAQHKVLKGIKENEIDGFNKEYNIYSKKCGFKKNYKALNDFCTSMMHNNVKKITN